MVSDTCSPYIEELRNYHMLFPLIPLVSCLRKDIRGIERENSKIVATTSLDILLTVDVNILFLNICNKTIAISVFLSHLCHLNFVQLQGKLINFKFVFKHLCHHSQNLLILFQGLKIK